MPPTDKDKSKKNAKEQYEALGRFVEAFEAMVDEVRGVCLDRLWAITRNTDMDTDPEYFSRKMVLDIPFHNQSMTAKPLWDVMRAIIVEIVSQKYCSLYEERECLKSLLGFMASEYEELYSKRNALLHGTWFIGFVSEEDPNNEKFRIRKFQTTATGLQTVKELPQEVSQLTSLTMRCDEMRTWIAEIDYCFREQKPLSDHFKCEKKRWFHRHIRLTHDWTTLPERRAR